MPLPLTALQVFKFNNDVLPAFTDAKIGDHLGGLGPNPSGGAEFFVNGNEANDLGDGLSWASPKQLFASAVTLNNTEVAKNRAAGGYVYWAARNRIHCKGDTLAEDITVLPNKCDIIGHGSHDSNPMCTLEGDHTIGAAAYQGTRFWNMRFLHKNAAGDIFTVPATTGGLAFIGCVFDAHQDTKAGGALVITGVLGFKVLGCRFIGAYSDAVIELGAGAIADCIIADNIIEGADKGIEVNASFTMGQWQGYILRNTFHTTLACIDDNSSLFVINDNRGVTLAPKGSLLAGAVDGEENLAMGNRFTTSDATNVLWPAEGAI